MLIRLLRITLAVAAAIVYVTTDNKDLVLMLMIAALIIPDSRPGWVRNVRSKV